MYYFVLKFFPQMWQYQLDQCGYPCGKDIQGNALSNVLKICQAKLKIAEHLQKISNFFLVPSQRYQHFIHNLLNPKPKPMIRFSSTLIPACSILRLRKNCRLNCENGIFELWWQMCRKICLCVCVIFFCWGMVYRECV